VTDVCVGWQDTTYMYLLVTTTSVWHFFFNKYRDCWPICTVTRYLRWMTKHHLFTLWRQILFDNFPSISTKIIYTVIYADLYSDWFVLETDFFIDRFVQEKCFCVGWQDTIYLPCDDRFCLILFLSISTKIIYTVTVLYIDGFIQR